MFTRRTGFLMFLCLLSSLYSCASGQQQGGRGLSRVSVLNFGLYSPNDSGCDSPFDSLLICSSELSASDISSVTGFPVHDPSRRSPFQAAAASVLTHNFLSEGLQGLGGPASRMPGTRSPNVAVPVVMPLLPAISGAELSQRIGTCESKLAVFQSVFDRNTDLAGAERVKLTNELLRVKMQLVGVLEFQRQNRRLLNLLADRHGFKQLPPLKEAGVAAGNSRVKGSKKKKKKCEPRKRERAFDVVV